MQLSAADNKGYVKQSNLINSAFCVGRFKTPLTISAILLAPSSDRDTRTIACGTFSMTHRPENDSTTRTPIDSAELDPRSWVETHGDALFAYAISRLGDRNLAEDAVQDTYLAAVKARLSFKGGSQARTWLIGILRHKISDIRRKTHRETQTADLQDSDEFDGASSSIDAWFDSTGHWRKQPASWSVDPGALMSQEEFFSVLRDCLEKIPGRAGDAFTLRFVNNIPPEEVCKVMEISSTNFWVLLHRARTRLRSCLEVNWFGIKSHSEP